MTQLIALSLIAAGTVADITADITEGVAFEVPPESAETLLTQGLAKLATESLTGASASPDPVTKASKSKAVKARVLVTCLHGQPDDVVTLSADIAKVAEAAGQVDTNNAAVAYALSLQAQA